MLVLIGSFLGFIGSLVPEIFKLLRDRSDQAHELSILDRQVGMMKLKHKLSLEELEAVGQNQARKVLYKYPHKMGIPWVDALSGSVRPLITYAFFVLYIALKGVQMYGLWHLFPTSGWEVVLHKIWGEEDQVLFATVMSFWFGQRALMRRLKK